MPSSITQALKTVIRGRRKALASWWQQGIIIPALIDVRGTWQDYQQQISRKAAYNLRTAFTMNADLEYRIIDGFDKDLVARFISVWNKFYRTPPDFLHSLSHTYEKGWLRVRGVQLNGTDIAIHLIEQYDRYALCHAPWFDRDAYRERGLGTYMWFRLIEQATTDPTLDFLDIGGGPVASLPAGHYKRRYNPRDLGFRVKACSRCNYLRMFRDIQEIMSCPHCGASVGVWRYVARFRS